MHVFELCPRLNAFLLKAVELDDVDVVIRYCATLAKSGTR